jgi:hypothetical protein
MGWLALLFLLLVIGVVVFRGFDRSVNDDKPDDLKRADDEDPSRRQSMLGRYWPGPF